VIVVIFAAIAALSQAEPASISEKVSFTSEGAASVIHIETTVKADKAVAALKPRCYYGTPNIPQYIQGLEALDGSKVIEGAEGKVQLEPNAKGVVHFRYSMVYPASIGDNYTFAPICSPKHFRSQLCQWMYSIGDPEKEYSYQFEVGSVPKGWVSYSSLGATDKPIRLKASFSSMISAVMGAGDVHHRTAKINGQPVDFILDKGFALDSKQMLDQAESIVRVQRKWFNDNSFPHYVVSIAERPDNVAGTCVNGAFVCFLRPEASRIDLLKLVAHEMCHNWVPQKMSVSAPTDDAGRWNWEWFDEGFDEYVSWMILRESGAMSQDQFVEALNYNNGNIADNPHRLATLEEVGKTVVAGQFSVAHKKLSYYRGALMAADWDAEIRRRSGGKRNLGNAIRELYALAAKTGGVITPEAFEAFFAKEGIDAKAWRERHINRGEAIPIDPQIGGEGYELRTKKRPLYDEGFDLVASRAAKKIVGVKPGGAAEKAGLKDGMEYVGSENSNRFGNAYRPDQPLTIIVKVDGAERRVAYRAEGELIDVVVIEKR
jgi:predicted metalloprotease with PDZ domain